MASAFLIISRFQQPAAFRFPRHPVPVDANDAGEALNRNQATAFPNAR
jgi:hypothetical protein